MGKTYQPSIIEKSKELVGALSESGFFVDYEITDTEFAEKYISDTLTDKFITGELDFEGGDLFTEDEFDKLLRDIVAGSILNELKKSGLVESYEDDATEELFFLTEKGKLALKERNKKIED